MKRTDPIHVAVAETSVIVRSGLISVLKRLPDIPVQPVEITSMEGLHNCMQGHRPEVLIVNPGFGGWFNVDEFKATYPQTVIKCVSLLCSMTDSNLLKVFCSNFWEMGFSTDPSEVFWVVCVNPLLSEEKKFHTRFSWEDKLDEEQ